MIVELIVSFFGFARISCTWCNSNSVPKARACAKDTPAVGQKLRGKVAGLSKWGAFVDIGERTEGFHATSGGQEKYKRKMQVHNYYNFPIVQTAQNCR